MRRGDGGSKWKICLLCTWRKVKDRKDETKRTKNQARGLFDEESKKPRGVAVLGVVSESARRRAEKRDTKFGSGAMGVRWHWHRRQTQTDRNTQDRHMQYNNRSGH